MNTNKPYLLCSLCLLMSAVPLIGDLAVTGKFGATESDIDAVVRNNPIDVFDDVTYGVLPTTASSVAITESLTPSKLSDGSAGTGYRVNISNTPTDNGSPATLTWALNLTSSPTGYSLEQLRVVTYGNTGLLFSSFDLSVKYLGDAEFTQLSTSTITYPDTVRGSSQSSTVFGTELVYAETIVSAASGAYFATGVSEVRLTIYPVAKNFFKTPGSFADFSEAFMGSNYTNIDMIGVATPVPESSAFPLIAGAMTLALFMYRRLR